MKNVQSNALSSLNEMVSPEMLFNMVLELAKVDNMKYQEFDLEINDENFLYRNFLDSYFRFFSVLKNGNFKYDPSDPYVYYDGIIIKSFTYDEVMKIAMYRKEDIVKDYLICLQNEDICGGEFEEAILKIVLDLQEV